MLMMHTNPPIRKSEQIDHFVRVSSCKPRTTGMGIPRRNQSVTMLMTPKAMIAAYISLTYC